MTALALHAIEARETRNAFGGAVGIHALLAIGLLVSLNWNQDAPKPVQAELWSGLPRDIPQTKQPPTPAVKPEPPAPPAPAPAPEEKADISLQKKKADPPKKQEPTKAELQKEKERQEELKKQLLKKQAEEQSVTKRLEAQRQAELARLGIDPNAKPSTRGKDVATKSGLTNGAEVGAKTGTDADYEALIQARIKIRINYPDRAPGNPEAIVIVEQLPTGEVTKVQLIRPSGTPAWDEAVQRAVWAASPLPKRKDGTVARVLELSFKPKESR
ncbi:MAG: cell envelope integrity protein TolA [Burkholderiaceae bacterium]|nr:cell envelope integrity protein TolA [Burkholderiaceae bacterium]